MELLVRTTVIYWFLFLVMRGSGKRSLAELTPLDVVILVVMGDIVQQGVNQEDMSMTGAIVAVGVFAAWTLVGDWAARRWRTAKRLLAGEPVIVVRDGSILEERLRQERLTEDDVLTAAREHGYSDLGHIAIGVLEDDGSFSFVRDANTESPRSAGGSV